MIRNKAEKVTFLDGWRFDSWVNFATGFGTNSDKTTATHFVPDANLTDAQLTDLYKNNALAGKLVDIYPREEMREKWHLEGTSDDPEAEKFVKRFNFTSKITEARIWGRLYGGARIWIAVDDGLTPDQPLGDTYLVNNLHVLDRRCLDIVQRYQQGPQAGLPELYRVHFKSKNMTGEYSAYIHESRMLAFPGDRTDPDTKASLGGWDLSVLQRAYDNLRSEGIIWKGTEVQVSDGNQSVFKIKDLLKAIAQNKGEQLLSRVRIMDLLRSVSRAVILDAENEEFSRVPAQFGGLPELNDRALKRVATTGEIPVTVLAGEAPAGLNATGDSDLRWFLARIVSGRELITEPQMLLGMFIILRSVDSPVHVEDIEDLSLWWDPLWQPTALERAQEYSAYAQGDKIYLEAEVVLPEEVCISRFAGVDSELPAVDVDVREKILKESLDDLLAPKPEPPAPPPMIAPGVPGVSPAALNGPPADGAVVGQNGAE